MDRSPAKRAGGEEMSEHKALVGSRMADPPDPLVLVASALAPCWLPSLVSMLLSIGPVLLSILVSIAKSILTHSRYEKTLDWSGF